MIYIALGANLDSDIGTPIDTLKTACNALIDNNITIIKKSNIWSTAPVPFDPKQNWYHNAVIAVETNLPPHDLLALLLSIEKNLGRVRDGHRNSARIIDLDILAYHDDIIQGYDLTVPHPRMSERLFVLSPLSDIVDNWTHPETGQNLTELIKSVPMDQQAKKLEEAW